jgi:hypothetical protein
MIRMPRRRAASDDLALVGNRVPAIQRRAATARAPGRILGLACLAFALSVAWLPARAAASDDPLADLEQKSIALLILNNSEFGNSEFGVGFVVASTPTASYLLTAAHVLGCADTPASGCRDSVKVRFPGQLSSIDGHRVLAWKDQSEGDRDLALVEIDRGNLDAGPNSLANALGRRFLRDRLRSAHHPEQRRIRRCSRSSPRQCQPDPIVRSTEASQRLGPGVSRV